MSAETRTAGSRFLENLAYLVPGYAGYKVMSQRREEDSRLRALLLRRLSEIRGTAVELLARISETASVSSAEELERRAQTLDTLADAIRYAPYGFSGFFDAPEVEESTLERILEVDLLLFEDLDAIEQALLHPGNPVADRASSGGLLDRLDRSIARFESHLILRDKILGDI